MNLIKINAIILNIRDNKIQRKELIDKFGKDWITLHIDNGVILEKKILYSYESIIKTEVDRKTQKKERQFGLVEDETDLDYKTNIKKELRNFENEYYELLNSTGQIIWTGQQINNQDFSSMIDGLYFLRIYNGNSTQTTKLIKD